MGWVREEEGRVEGREEVLEATRFNCLYWFRSALSRQWNIQQWEWSIFRWGQLPNHPHSCRRRLLYFSTKSLLLRFQATSSYCNPLRLHPPSCFIFNTKWIRSSSFCSIDLTSLWQRSTPLPPSSRYAGCGGKDRQMMKALLCKGLSFPRSFCTCAVCIYSFGTEPPKRVLSLWMAKTDVLTEWHCWQINVTSL